MKTYSFYTIIPSINSFDLSKDPGAIPSILKRDYKYNSYFVSCIKPKENDYYINNYKYANLIFLPSKGKGVLSMANTDILSFIAKNAKKIDILNLYYLKHSILYAITYKLFNPSGILYLKLDMDTDSMRKYELQKMEVIRKPIFKWYLKHFPNIISVETSDCYNYIKQRFNLNSKKLLYIPDGIDDKEVENKKCTFEEKENLIISVQRVGTYQKNTEMLLEIASKTELKDWKIVVIGNIEPTFRSKIDLFYKENPNKKDHIIFKGPIYDKKELFEWYNRAKVFILTSVFESFGLVFVEAQYFGNYIISTPVSSISDIIEGNIGFISNNVTAIKLELESIINDDKLSSEIYSKAIAHSKKFYWSNILLNLHNQIKSINIPKA